MFTLSTTGRRRPGQPLFAVVLNLLGGCATNRLHLTLVDAVPALEDVRAVADVR
jgi:hypothetical protein